MSITFAEPEPHPFAPSITPAETRLAEWALQHWAAIAEMAAQTEAEQRHAQAMMDAARRLLQRQMQ